MLLVRTMVPKIASSSGIDVGIPAVLPVVPQRHVLANRRTVERFGVFAAGLVIHVNPEFFAALGIDEIDSPVHGGVRSSSAQSWTSISSLP